QLIAKLPVKPLALLVVLATLALATPVLLVKALPLPPNPPHLTAFLWGMAVAAGFRSTRWWGWVAFSLGMMIFILPLLGMTEFSLAMRRGVYSFDAYVSVLNDPNFRATFSYSVFMGFLTIAFGILLVVPTAYWVRLRVPELRPVIEFITL